jgi:hypothetical protein
MLSRVPRRAALVFSVDLALLDSVGRHWTRVRASGCCRRRARSSAAPFRAGPGQSALRAHGWEEPKGKGVLRARWRGWLARVRSFFVSPSKVTPRASLRSTP